MTGRHGDPTAAVPPPLPVIRDPRARWGSAHRVAAYQTTFMFLRPHALPIHEFRADGSAAACLPGARADPGMQRRFERAHRPRRQPTAFLRAGHHRLFELGFPCYWTVLRPELPFARPDDHEVDAVGGR